MLLIVVLCLFYLITSLHTQFLMHISADQTSRWLGLTATSHESLQFLLNKLLSGSTLLCKWYVLQVNAQIWCSFFNATRWQSDVAPTKAFQLIQLITLQTVLKSPCQLLGYLFTLSLATCIVLQLHVQVKWTFGPIELVAPIVRTDEALVNLICASAEVLLTPTQITLIVCRWLLRLLGWLRLHFEVIACGIWVFVESFRSNQLLLLLLLLWRLLLSEEFCVIPL